VAKHKLVRELEVYNPGEGDTGNIGEEVIDTK
jgi:hypothetical protein